MKRSSLAAVFYLASAVGCSTHAEQPMETGSFSVFPEKAISDSTGISSLTAQPQRWLAASTDGLTVINDRGEQLASLPGTFDLLDSRGLFTIGEKPNELALTIDEESGLPVLVAVDIASNTPRRLAEVPADRQGVEGLCLYRDQGDNLFAFLLDGNGRAGQWLLYDGASKKVHIAPVRDLPVPPGSEQCDADDSSGALFVSEESLGIWQYNADPETDHGRQLIDVGPPHGGLAVPVGDLATLHGALAVALPDSGTLRLYSHSSSGWQAAGELTLPEGSEPEYMSASRTGDTSALLLTDETTGRLYRLTTPATEGTPVTASASYPLVLPTAETEPVESFGDAADDPAIWVHPENPRKSRVLGTDKQWGLKVYDLEGKLLQSIGSGDINNVDLRQGSTIDGKTRDLAIASNRDDNSITLYDIDPESGTVEELGSIATNLEEIYGICMYMPSPGEVYAIPNDKDGRFQQYRIRLENGIPEGEMVREFMVASQPEGCVADDRTGQLFIGEEAEGVWVLDGDPDSEANLTSVAKTGEHLIADVEGLALYHGAQQSWLVVSSQGDNSYAFFESQAPFKYRGSVRIGLNAALGIDGASETDGLAVSSQNLGSNYLEGLLVVQDGRNVMPEEPQNFKLVPWDRIRKALGL